MNRYTKYGAIVAITILLGVLFYKKVYVPKTTYVTVKATVGDLEIEVFGLGEVSATQIYTISPNVSAKILEVAVKEGDYVHKGDLLVRLDPVDLPKQIDQSHLAYEKAKKDLLALKAQLQSLYVQQEFAKKSFERYAKLKAKSYASQVEYDKAKRDFDALQAQIEASKLQIDATTIEIKRSKEAIEALRLKLQQFTITAPVDGFVIDKMVTPAQSVVPSMAMVKIVNPNDVRIRAYVDERISINVTVGDTAVIILRSLDTKKFRGYVARVLPQSDAITQERIVEVAFKKLPNPFYMNEQAEVYIKSQKVHGVIIPSQVLRYYHEKEGVWIVRDAKASFVPVTIKARAKERVVVEGLQKDAVILVPSSSKKSLHEGMRVHI